MKRFLLVAAISLCTLVPAHGQHFVVDADKVLSVNMLTSDVGPFTSSLKKRALAFSWTKDITDFQKAAIIRVHMTIKVRLTAGSCTLHISGPAGDVGSLTCNQLRHLTSYWSHPIAGNRAGITVSASSADVITIVVDKLAYAVQPARPESLVALSPLRSITQAIVPARWKSVAPAVAMLEYIKGGQKGVTCTAFLVTPSIVMTNNHCVSDNSVMDSLVAVFDYNDASSKTSVVSATEVIVTDVVLDYSLIRLDRGMSDRTPLKMSASMPLSDHFKLAIIQHPGSEPKQIAYENCFVRPSVTDGRVPGSKVDFGHLCSTLGGSSGSPVFDASSVDSVTVVGLHHLGFDDKAVPPIMINQGIYMKLILCDIRTKSPTVADEIDSTAVACAR